MKPNYNFPSSENEIDMTGLSYPSRRGGDWGYPKKKYDVFEVVTLVAQVVALGTFLYALFFVVLAMTNGQ